jgi:hypothetical protein
MPVQKTTYIIPIKVEHLQYVEYLRRIERVIGAGYIIQVPVNDEQHWETILTWLRGCGYQIRVLENQDFVMIQDENAELLMQSAAA